MSDRFICTKENPWTKDKGRAIHPDAKSTYSRDGWPSGDLQNYICPNCKLEFEVEIAQ